jgi:alpha-L-rhamnosidase
MNHDTISWSASWIASAHCGDAASGAPAPYLRKAFALQAPVVEAVLHATALGLYECELNGKKVGDLALSPGWTDYKKRVHFQSYDVKDLLIQGDNVLGAILGDGWYAGHVAWQERQQYGDRPQFLAQLDITLEGGNKVRIVSDGEWTASAGPILENDLLMGETYDARLSLDGWSTAGFDARQWQPVEVMPDPEIVIERSPAPPVRRVERLKPTDIGPIRKVGESHHARLIDFGQNISGRIQIEVRGKAGVSLKIIHAEVLTDDGTPYTENLRKAKATDTYILRGHGPESWEPRFTFHGFRYAEISWAGEADALEWMSIDGVVLYSDMAVTGSFECSHPLLNQLARNILWGQKGNFLDIPTDCPQRDERLGWTGDAQVFVRTAAFFMDVRGFFHKWMKDLRDAQKPSGAIPAVAPDTGAVNEPDGGPAWADAALICPWTIYRCYGDLEILRESYESMEKYMDYLAEHKVIEYIRAHPDLAGWAGYGDWLALDGSGRVEGGTSIDLIGTAHYANDADIMAQTCKLLEKPDKAREYRALHGRIVEAFRNRFVTPDGLLACGTQTAYVLALHFRLLPEKSMTTAARELVRNIERNGMRLATGFVGTPYLLHVLEAHAYLDVAYQLLEQENSPSWLFPVKNGATTIWERWNGWTPENGFETPGMNSFNHYAYGAVGDWMVSSVAGLEIGKPGYKEIIFKPRPGGTLTWAEANLNTPFGAAGIRWERQDDELLLYLKIPKGSEAHLSLPEGWSVDRKHFPPGSYKLSATKGFLQ